MVTLRKSGGSQRRTWGGKKSIDGGGLRGILGITKGSVVRPAGGDGYWSRQMEIDGCSAP